MSYRQEGALVPQDDLSFSTQAFGIPYILSHPVSGCDVVRSIQVPIVDLLSSGEDRYLLVAGPVDLPRAVIGIQGRSPSGQYPAETDTACVSLVLRVLLDPAL